MSLTVLRCVFSIEPRRFASSAFDTGEARGAVPRDRVNGTMSDAE